MVASTIDSELVMLHPRCVSCGLTSAVFHSVPEGTPFLQFCTYICNNSRNPNRKNWFMKNVKSDRGSQSSTRKAKPARRRANRRRRRDLGLAGLMEQNLQSMKIGDLYRPLKKPVTLRLDADVIAWFKKDGRRYQTRINAALRKVMGREMRYGSPRPAQMEGQRHADDNSHVWQRRRNVGGTPAWPLMGSCPPHLCVVCADCLYLSRPGFGGYLCNAGTISF